MTAEPDLLPLPEPTRWCITGAEQQAMLCEWATNYARANVAHATAAKDAEIEALRVKVGDYRTNGAAAVRFAPNSAYWSNELRRLFGDDARTGIEVLENQYRQELARAERLAEALEEIRSRSSINLAMHPDPSALTARLGDIYQIADAALAREGGQ